MNFPIVKEYKFDIDGSNPENLITDEPREVPSGLLGKVIVPRHAAFFVESLSITDGSGRPLKLDEHYRIYKLMGRATAYTSKEVACLIEILDEGITDVLMTYQTVGTMTLFDIGLMSLAIEGLNDNRPVDYENITNKPIVFPPTLHGHSLLMDIVMFQDSVDFVEEFITALIRAGKPLEDKLNSAYDNLMWYIDLYTKRIKQMVENHANAYDAHGLTAMQVGLGLVNNHATATVAQMLQADRDDLIITPPDVQAFVREYGFDPGNYLEINKIPLSHYGNKNFIPPAIDGSFEGIGSKSECTGYCVEKDGTLITLRNHFDGRTEGLYYSLIKNYKADKPEFVFTGYKYQNQRILGDGVKVTRVVQGTNEKIIMVGEQWTNNWYVGLSNGTLDFNKHVMCKVDMSAVLARVTEQTGETAIVDEYRLGIHYFGKWCYLLLSIDNIEGPDIGSGSRIFFFRALTADIAKGGTVKFNPINVSYDTVEGESFTNQAYLRPWKRVLDANGRCVQSYWKYIPYTTSQGNTGWKPINLSCYDESGATPALIRLQYYMQPNFTEGDVAKILEIRPQVIYRFDAEACRLVMQGKTPVQTINFNTMSQEEIYKIREDHAVGGAWIRQNSGVSPGFAILPTGEYVTPEQPGNSAYPCSYGIYNYGKTRKYDICNLVFTKGIATEPTKGYSNGLIRSPLVNNSKPTAMGFDGSNEILNGNNQDWTTVKLFRNYFYRKVTGGYQEREGVTNVNFPLRSRPLVNTVVNTDVPIGMPFVNYSGDSASLSAAGVEMGAHSFSIGMDNNGKGPVPDGNGTDPVIYEKSKDGIPLTFPKKTTWEKGPNETVLGEHMHLRFDSYYGLTEAARQKIYNTVVPAQYRGNSKQFTIAMIDGTGGVYKKAAFGLACVGWLVPERREYNFKIVLLSLVMEGPNTSHPNVDVMKDFTVLSETPITVMASVLGDRGAYMSIGDRIGTMQIYKEGDILRIGFYNPMMNAVVGDTRSTAWNFSVDTNTFAITYHYSSDSSWFAGGHGYCFQSVPRYGIGQNLGGDESGQAALITEQGGNHYMMASIYPETGWIIYFQLPQDVVIYGSEYYLPEGTIDLRDIESSPGNKTFYIYVNYKDGKVSYEVTTDKKADSTFHLWIGRVITNERQILTIERMNVFLINNSRVSEQKRGSSIPASSGGITTEGQIAWVKDSELI